MGSRVSRSDTARAGLALTLVASALLGCQQLFGIEERQAAADGAAADGGAGYGGEATVFRVCEPPLAADGTDWSCVQGQQVRYPDTVTLTGTFDLTLSGASALERFAACLLPPVPDASTDGGAPYCEDRMDELCEVEGGAVFTMVVDRGQHAEIAWLTDGVTNTASMWLGPSAREVVDVGTVALLSWGFVVLTSWSLGVEQADDAGVVFASVRDCTGRLAPGLRLAVTRQGESVGTPFALQATVPVLGDATDSGGLAGVFNVTPGWVTVHSYLPDGCLVAEVDLVVMGGELTFVDLAPSACNAAAPQEQLPCAGGAAGATADG
jgi:hypothetical protein